MGATPEAGPVEAGDREAPAGGPRRSIVDTWTEVFADAGGLVRAEAALARAETAANLKAVGVQSAKLVAGLVLMILALIFATVAVVVAIAQLTGLLPALLIVAGLSVAAGLLLILSGKGRLADQQILPERSLDRMTRDLDRLSSRAAAPLVAQPTGRGPGPAPVAAGPAGGAVGG